MALRTGLGAFTWRHPCWVSEPIPVPLFGGAAIRIQVFAESEQDLDALSPAEEEALQAFLSQPAERLQEITPHVRQNYEEMWDDIGPPDILEITDAEDIWRHVTPTFVTPEASNNGPACISIEAECDWEIEHGLQLVLLGGTKWIRVSACDGHVSDGDAWGKPRLDAWMDDPSATLPVRSSDDLNKA